MWNDIRHSVYRLRVIKANEPDIFYAYVYTNEEREATQDTWRLWAKFMMTLWNPLVAGTQKCNRRIVAHTHKCQPGTPY